MRDKIIKEIQREHELLMTEIMLLKDDLNSLRREIKYLKQPQRENVIKVEVQPRSSWEDFPY